ncbi:MAG: hypothetical protein E7570_01260 [Ruminococcaceae bacterium]|nr:hypothetical protein [Oscillospiraceae bacterium]
MAKIIVSSRFVKNPSAQNTGKLIRYMGTREGVEKLPKGIDNSPSTKQQRTLISRIIKHYPDTMDYVEFDDYLNLPSKANATEFISAVVERNADRTDELKSLVSYIAERPGVEKLGSHGLFSQSDDAINIDKVAEQVSNHQGVVWTHVVSLRREDAERLGYNNAQAWKDCVRRNMNELAEAHKIPVSDMQWYAAFHNTSHHPHIHLIVYSKSGQGYLTKKGMEKMRSTFGNDIFRNEQMKLFREQTEIRDALKAEMEDVLEGFASMRYPITDETAELILQLQNELNNCKGKKVYGYLPKNVKETVNKLLGHIVNENSALRYMYAKWNEINHLKLSLYYESDKDSDIPIEDNKEFRSLKNMLIKTVLEVQISVAESEWESADSNINLFNRILKSIASLFSSKATDRINAINAQKRNQKDGKVLSKEQQKRIAHGERSIDVSYDKKEKNKEDSRRATENAEALFAIASGIIDLAKHIPSQQQTSQVQNYYDDTDNFDEDEGFSMGGI